MSADSWLHQSSNCCPVSRTQFGSNYCSVKSDHDFKDNIQAIFHKAYSVSFALCEQVEQELNSVEAQGIMYPVKHLNFASRIFIAPKTDNFIRMCTGCKRL